MINGTPERFVVDNTTGDTFVVEKDGRVFLLNGGSLQKDGWSADADTATVYLPVTTSALSPAKITIAAMVSTLVLVIAWLCVGLTIGSGESGPPTWWALIMTVFVTSCWTAIGILVWLSVKDDQS